MNYKQSTSRNLWPILVIAGVLMWWIMGASTVSAAPDDKAITLAIETDLLFNEEVPAHLIDVATAKGIVTLSGSVDNLMARRKATEIAERIKGVRAVVNNIEVRTVERSDESIKKDVAEALLRDPAADAYEVHVNVTDGIVTLTGVVESWQEKQLAETVTSGVKGVVDIVNHIKIDYPKGDRSDIEIKREVERRLEEDVWVDEKQIDVEVDDGLVRLSGRVGSAIEWRQALSDGWVYGTEDVKADDLEIKWWEKDPYERTSEFVAMTDDEISRVIQDAFLYDPRVFSFNVDVRVDKGVATLTGTVDNLKAKTAAEKDALNTRGVWMVKNHLRVRPDNRPSDSRIKEEIKNAIARDPYLNLHNLSFDVVNGLAYVYGDVNTSFEKMHAEDIISRVKGIIDVENLIQSNFEWTWKSDREIKKDVEDQLYWSPYVNASDVNIKVDNGIVTLSGQVDTYAESVLAETNAYQGGAKDVMNNLEVRLSFQ